MLLYFLGVLTPVVLYFLVTWVYPRLTLALYMTLWQIRGSNLFIWAIFDTYLRQKRYRPGPRLSRVHRVVKRRVERWMAKEVTQV